MKGQILDYSIPNNSGIISGDDQKRYHFIGNEWRDQHAPYRGQRVDFDIDSSGQAVAIYLIQSRDSFGTQYGEKNRIVAIFLAFFLGGLGIHKFYLGRIGWGIVYLIFFWTFIPTIVAFVEFIIYICMSDEEFAKKYG